MGLRPGVPRMPVTWLLYHIKEFYRAGTKRLPTNRKMMVILKDFFLSSYAFLISPACNERKQSSTCAPEEHTFDDLPGVGRWLGRRVLGLGLCGQVPADAAIAGHLREKETRVRRENAT